jgi:Phage integrase, N-terminal SAM-like domain
LGRLRAVRACSQDTTWRAVRAPIDLKAATELTQRVSERLFMRFYLERLVQPRAHLLFQDIFTNGKLIRRWAYGKTTSEVREKMDAMKSARNTHLLTTESAAGMTFGTYLEKWLAHVEERIKAKTHKEYTRVANSRLTPILGKKKLEKLTPLDLETAIRQIRLEHSPSEARQTHTIAGIALKQALRWQLVPRNIKEAVTAPKSSGKR